MHSTPLEVGLSELSRASVLDDQRGGALLTAGLMINRYTGSSASLIILAHGARKTKAPEKIRSTP